jgi:hypothetical protein
MNKITLSYPDRGEKLQDRFGARVAAALSERLTAQATPDIDARLRFAREQALAHVRAARPLASACTAMALPGGNAAVLAGPRDGAPWWLRLSALLPLAVLLAGLAFIDHRYAQSQIEAAADVDAAILADDLPPDAYRDAGFVEFLKSARP